MTLKESYECSGKMNILNNGMEMRKGGPTQSNEQSDLVGTPHLTSKKKGALERLTWVLTDYMRIIHLI